jgi:hypothetical protein
MLQKIVVAELSPWRDKNLKLGVSNRVERGCSCRARQVWKAALLGRTAVKIWTESVMTGVWRWQRVNLFSFLQSYKNSCEFRIITTALRYETQYSTLCFLRESSCAHVLQARAFGSVRFVAELMFCIVGATSVCSPSKGAPYYQSPCYSSRGNVTLRSLQGTEPFKERVNKIVHCQWTGTA